MKKEILTPVAVVALSVVFVLLSALVTASKGRSPWLIKKKLRIGALLLMLTGLAIGGSACSVTCYTPGFDPDGNLLDGNGRDGGDLQDGGDFMDGGEVIACYVDARPDSMHGSILVEGEASGAWITIDLASDPVLSGVVGIPSPGEYSYLVADAEEIEVQRGPLEASDGAFDVPGDEFEITLRQDLISGDYKLYLYSFSVDILDEYKDYWTAYWRLRISN